MTDDATRRDRLAAALHKARGHVLTLTSPTGFSSCGCYEMADAIIAADPSLFDDGALRALVEAADTGGPVIHLAVTPTLRAALAASPAPAGLDAAYRERNAVVAALIRTNGWPAQVTMAPDTEGWWIVYAETPQGQVSWHVSPDDMDLFRDVPVSFGTHHSPWDGHTTEEKYRRVAALASPDSERPA